MDLIKDLLISAFFDAALAILWAGALAMAWRRTSGFVREPLKTTVDEVKTFWSKVKGQDPSRVVYMVIPLVISFYLVGTVMQRISDDFIETTSSWMPKPANLTEFNEFKLEPIGTDDGIKEQVIDEYRHFVAQDDELIKLNEHWRNVEKCNKDKAKKGKDKVIRDSRTRRAFSDSGSGPYMQRLLEPVRICQATLMHSFLLSFILFSLAVVIGANQLCRRPRSRLFAFWVWAFALLAWTGLLAPTLHDPKEYNFPVLLVFTMILVPLVATGKKILLGQEKEEIERQRRDKSFRSVYQLLMAAGAVLIFCYWSTFSWAEHRANFVEAALVLGGGPSDATLAATPPSSSAAAVKILQEKLADVEQLTRRGVEIRVRTLGKEHPETLDAMNNLGEVLSSLGRIPEAEALHRETFEIRRRVLGPEHPRTLDSLMNVGHTLARKGDTAGAQALYAEVWKLRLRTLGEDHPDTWFALAENAGALDELGRHSEAAPLRKRAVAELQRLLGKDHPAVRDLTL